MHGKMGPRRLLSALKNVHITAYFKEKWPQISLFYQKATQNHMMGTVGTAPSGRKVETKKRNSGDRSPVSPVLGTPVVNTHK